MRSCIAAVSRKIDVRTSFVRIGAMHRNVGTSARNALFALRSVHAVANAHLPRHRCAPCVALSSTLPLLYASKDSPAC
ncbi:magnesium transporter [Xanthomonas oryzae]|nr:magnesium transporter [Xanthomonas oryzae]